MKTTTPYWSGLARIFHSCFNASKRRLLRSAGFQPAVSPTSSRQPVRTRCGLAGGQRVGNPRYSRLEVCATAHAGLNYKISWLGAGLALALWLVPAPRLSAADEFTLDTARAAAAKGDAQAECFLAQCYAEGRGVPQDYPGRPLICARPPAKALPRPKTTLASAT